jgi:poly[(R)-3-hydroxyalkanoate] polymerase subunit PhaC
MEAAMAGAVTPDEVEPVVGGGEFLGSLDALGLLDAVTRVGRRVATTTAPQRVAQLTEELGRIAIGRSEVSPEPRDWRFENRAWQENPAYRRLAQSYLAWTDTLLALVDDADLDWRTEERARFAVRLVTSAVAPTNSFLLNPEALERAFETAGRSIWRGLRNLARDVTDNRGMPRSVAPGAYEVGRNLAMTPGAVVHANEVCELLQYTSTTAAVRDRPVVVVPPQINKYYVMDLAPGRSFVEHAVSRGFQTFAVSWRNPTAAQRDWGLATYVDALEESMEVAAEIAGSDEVGAVGVCAGGLTTAALLGRLAFQCRELIHSATFAVTQLDYSVPSTIGMLGVPDVMDRAARTSRRRGTLDAGGLGALFSMLRPNDLIWNYWVNNNLLGEDPPAFDVLAWNADGTSLPAALHAEFLDVFQHNALARGDLVLGDCPIDLQKVPCDILSVGARNDHLVPWQACFATTNLFGGPSDFVLSSSGHIQCLVNPPGSKKMSTTTGSAQGRDPDAWLATATEGPGVWWERWAEWQGARSGGEHKAPSQLGSRRHRPGAAAPGCYVHNE